MATWPSTLKINRANYSEAPPDRVIRTQMEAGFDKLRRRTTNAPRLIDLKLFLTDAEVTTLDGFYTANDADRFDFTDPRTNTTVRARFRSPPKYNLREYNWDVNVQLEIVS